MPPAATSTWWTRGASWSNSLQLSHPQLPAAALAVAALGLRQKIRLLPPARTGVDTQILWMGTQPQHLSAPGQSSQRDDLDETAGASSSYACWSPVPVPVPILH